MRGEARTADKPAIVRKRYILSSAPARDFEQPNETRCMRWLVAFFPNQPNGGFQ